MAIFALIGGKRNQETKFNKIENFLCKLTKKDNPTILYCPFASIDLAKSMAKFKEQMAGISCNILNMNYENLVDFEEMLIKCDIFFIGGGHCDELVSFFKNNKLDIILKKHLDDDIILAGSSAGAMLFTNASMGDRYMYHDNFHNYNYKMVECLGILNMTICPHYQNEDLVCYNDELKKYDCDAFGIEEDTMLVIDKDKYYVVKEEKKLGIYHFNKDDNYKMIPLYEGVAYEKNSGFRA